METFIGRVLKMKAVMFVLRSSTKFLPFNV